MRGQKWQKIVNEHWGDGGMGVGYSKRGFDGRCRDIELETRRGEREG